MYFIRGVHFGYEDVTNFNVFGAPLTPTWFDHRLVGENQDQLMTALGARFTFEADADSRMEIFLPDKPNGNFESVTTTTLVAGNNTRRNWTPFIHTGRGISLGLQILSGQPRIRRASVEYQQTGMLFEGDYEAAVTPEPEPEPGPEIFESDAILRPELVFMDHFSAGIAQSLGGGSFFYDQTGGRYSRFNEGPGDTGFSYSPTAGRDGGGCITAIDAARTLAVNPPVDDVIQASLITSHNLLGRIITVPEVIQRFSPHIFIQVMPDYTLRVVRNEVTTLVEIGTRTDYVVPANGEFVIETQASLAPQFYSKGGFVTSNLYTDGGPDIGVPIIRAIGVRTRSLFHTATDTFDSFALSIPKDTSSSGFGLAYPTATRKRYLYDTLFAPAWPTANGSIIQSAINYSHVEEFGTVEGEGPLLVGMNLIWGNIERWRNVLSILHSARNSDEVMNYSQGLGEISGFTGNWLSGPTYPPNPDPIIHNQLNGSARDQYHVSINRPGLVSIEAVGPMALVGVRTISGQYSSFPAVGGLLPWFFTGPRPVEDGINPPWPYGDNHHGFRLGVQSASGLVTLCRTGKAIGVDSHSEWRCMPGYTISPRSVLALDPATDEPFTPETLPEVLIEGNFDYLDAIEPAVDPGQRFVLVDVGQCALDVAYHKKDVIANDPEPRAPIAELATGSFSNISDGVITVRDYSVDFNDGPDALLTGIVSRTVDWGDGSPTESIAAGVAGQLEHTYTLHGTYTPSITVVNAHGLIASATLGPYTFVAQVPVAQFEAATNESDISGLTMDFTDTSGTVLDTIVSRLWDFGDGNTSTATNPTHTYAVPGTYTVTLSILTGTAQTAETDADLTVPIPGPVGDCGLSAAALADTPNVQADDFNGGGGNEAYVNTAAFAAIAYDQSPYYRAFYDFFYPSLNNGVDFSLDTVKTFAGQKTLKFRYGPGTSGGWDTSTADDARDGAGHPNDGFFAAGQPTTLWARLIFSLDPTMAAQIALSSGPYAGFTLIDPSGHGWDAAILIRAGSVWLDMQTKELDNVSRTRSVDLGIDPALFLQAGWGELIMFVQGVAADQTLRVIVWAGPSCELAGVAPITDQLKECQVSSPNPIFGISVRDIYWVNTDNYMSSPATDKYGNVALAEAHNNFTLADNPFGVGLP
jgi:hypothetical protein